MSADLESAVELTTAAPLPAAAMQLIAHRTPRVVISQLKDLRLSGDQFKVIG
jgi:hypothetical protein